MSLITCPECGRKKISDSAISCPDCGFAIREYFDIPSILKDIEESLDELLLQRAAYWYRYPAFKETYDRNGHVNGIPISALSAATPIDINYEPIDLVVNKAGEEYARFGKIEDGQKRYDGFVVGLVDLMSLDKYCGAANLWQTFYWVHVIKSIHLEELEQKTLFHVAAVTNAVIAPVWKKFAYDTLHPHIKPAKDGALLSAFEVSSYERFDTEYDADEIYEEWLECKGRNVEYTWDMLNAHSAIPEEIEEAESVVTQNDGSATQNKPEESSDNTKICPECGRVYANALCSNAVDHYCPEDGCKLETMSEKQGASVRQKERNGRTEESQKTDGGTGCIIALAVFTVLFCLFLLSTCSSSCSNGGGSSSNSSSPMTAEEAASQYYYDKDGHIRKK